jgi:hypothetical protein
VSSLSDLTKAIGFGDGDVRVEDSYEEGEYHIVGSSVILRALPDASSAIVAVLNPNETVYVFGDVETDPAHKYGPNKEAVPNDDPGDPGINYVRVGTETHGAGWVADRFIAPGAGVSNPKPVPPVPSPTPSPAPAPVAKKDLVMPVIVGGLIGTAVLGTIALVAHYSKRRAQFAHA